MGTTQVQDTRRASSMVRGTGCRETNLRVRRREKNVLDIPFYRSGDYTHLLPAPRERAPAKVEIGVFGARVGGGGILPSVYTTPSNGQREKGKTWSQSAPL